MTLRKRAVHETLTMQHNAGIGEEIAYDFKVGDRVITVDGIPGRVTAVLDGPYQKTEHYEVKLDNNLGGGEYRLGELRAAKGTSASLHEAAEVTASIPVEAVTSHTADIDYPELGTILYDRLPNENIKITAGKKKPLHNGVEVTDPKYPGESGIVRCDNCGKYHSATYSHDGRFGEGPIHAVVCSEDHLTDYYTNERLEHRKGARNINKADEPESASEDPGEHADQEEDEVEEPSDNENTDVAATEEPDDEAQPMSKGEQAESSIPDVDPPSACSFCGHDQFEDPQMTGRGARVRCSQCGGTMKSWGGQWEPEAPNSPQNQASGMWDYRSGGPGGVVQAPGANYKSSSIHEANILNWIVDKLYDKILEKNQRSFLSRDWSDPGILQEYEGKEYTTPCPHCGLGHTASIHKESDLDGEWTWHYTASWKDVQAKARRIRKEGHVKIVVATKTFVSGEVQGDHNVYESELNYVPGTKHIANWACGCKWASYTWGRSPQFRRFEGRLCSHALALQYEANSRGMFGREVRPDTHRNWDEVTVRYDKAQDEHLNRAASLDSDLYEAPELTDLHHAPVYASVQQMIGAGERTEDVIEMLASLDVSRESAKEMLHEALFSEAGYYLTVQGEEERRKKRDLSHHDKDKYDHTHHRTNDARQHAPHPGWGLPPGPYRTCDQCNGSGCGHCAGIGQIPDTDQSLTYETPDETADSGDLSTGRSSVEATLKTADFATNDPLSTLNDQSYKSTTPLSTSKNPASTGWATGQDPLDWGRSLIGNNFGLTSEASESTLHDEPEPALPSTDGAAEEDMIREAFLNSPGAKAMLADVPELQAKVAMKDFSYAEQQELISEGQGVRARNFNDLKIAGTHYELLGDDDIDEKDLFI